MTTQIVRAAVHILSNFCSSLNLCPCRAQHQPTRRFMQAATLMQGADLPVMPDGQTACADGGNEERLVPLMSVRPFWGNASLPMQTGKDHGCWAIDTSNSNSWKSAENSMLPKSAADVLLLQESKLSGPDAPSRIASRGKTFGWACDASSAHRTAFDKASGGCTVGVRRGYGLAPHSRVKDGFAHRVHFAWSAIVAKGGLHLGSIWLRDSEGLSADNLLILQETAAIIKQIRGPWVLGGD